MKFSILLFSVLVSLFELQAQEITLAITNCNVITMKSEKVLPNQTILIAKDKVFKVLPDNRWKNIDNIKVIDAKGNYVMPALAEMHTHGNAYSRWVFDIFLSYGITTIRFMAGNEALLAWRDSINNNLMLAPDIHVAGKLIDGAPPVWGKLHDGPVVTQIDSVEQIVNEQMKQGYEFIKLYARLDPQVYKKFLLVCFDKNIKVTGHIPVHLSKDDILTRQTGEIEHLSGYARLSTNIDTVSNKAISENSDLSFDEELAWNYSLEKIKMAARKTKKFNIWNCPTLLAEGIKLDSDFCKNLPQSNLGKKIQPVLPWWISQGYSNTPESYNYLLFKRAVIKELIKQKTNLLAGTDSPLPWLVPGLSLHQELEQLVLAGLTNYEALKTATVNPAKWFGRGYNKGTIEAGKQADLIILSANPLKDIRNTQKIESVIFKGKLLDTEK